MRLVCMRSSSRRLLFPDGREYKQKGFRVADIQHQDKEIDEGENT